MQTGLNSVRPFCNRLFRVRAMAVETPRGDGHIVKAELTTRLTGNPNDDQSWLKLFHWDDPLTVAVLYKDTNVKNGCCHVVQWKAELLVDLKRCPICNEPVGMICDGLVASNNGDPTNRVVRFKFGTRIFQLSTHTGTIQHAPLKSLTAVTTKSSWSSWWCGSVTHRTDTSQNAGHSHLAQERIARALDLVGLKVLHKGKVLYPQATRKEKRSEPLSTPMRHINNDGTISQHLLEISRKDWYGDATTDSCTTKVHESGENSANKKISLIVMGTLQARQLDEAPTTASGSVPFVPRLQQILFFPMKIVCRSFHIGWLFLRSLLAPFLPTSALTVNDSPLADDDVVRRDRIGTNRNRPHFE
jgi:hypothetical protein